MRMSNPFRICTRCSTSIADVALVKTQRLVAPSDRMPRVEQWLCPHCRDHFWVLIDTPRPCQNALAPECAGLMYPQPILSYPPHESADVPHEGHFTWRCTDCNPDLDQIDIADGPSDE